MLARLADLTWCDADGRRAGRVLAVPVGSTEQHGPHLPLSTDTDIAVALSASLAREVPSVVLGEPVAYGASGEHRDFAGTVSIGHDAVELLLVKLGRSATASFERVVFVSTHGGNAPTVARAVDTLCREGRDVRVWSPAWSGDAHAGRVETSVMLALCPERVRVDLAEPGNPAPLEELMPALTTAGV